MSEKVSFTVEKFEVDGISFFKLKNDPFGRGYWTEGIEYTFIEPQDGKDYFLVFYTLLTIVKTVRDTMLSVARDDTARLLLVFKLDEKKIEDKNVLEIQVFLDKEPIDTIHLEGVAKPQLANHLFPDNEKIWVVIYANPFYNNGFEWTMMLPEEY